MYLHYWSQNDLYTCVHAFSRILKTLSIKRMSVWLGIFLIFAYFLYFCEYRNNIFDLQRLAYISRLLSLWNNFLYNIDIKQDNILFCSIICYDCIIIKKDITVFEKLLTVLLQVCCIMYMYTVYRVIFAQCYFHLHLQTAVFACLEFAQMQFC